MTSYVPSRRFEVAVFSALAALTSVLIGTLLHAGFAIQVVA
jgi:hypothetical protein